MQPKNGHPQAQRLDDLLRLVGQVRPDDKSKKLTAFLGLRGSNRQGLLMIVGRAPNGWAGGRLPSEFRRERVRRDMIDRVIEKTDDLAGVVERNRKSRFWQVAEKVADQMMGRPSEDRHWTTEISYSNLFKVARAEGKRKNPKQGLRLLQQPLCVRILTHEILLWRPSRVLFMTGLSWAAPFVTAWEGTHLELTGDEEIQATSRLSVPGREVIPAVIADHPQPKSPKRYANKITELFRHMEGDA